jgi:ATP/maltotriose-dependent transcriptional regulator MalT
MGRFGEAERMLTRAREVAKQHGQFDMLCVLEVVTVFLARLGGNVASPLDHARSATELAERVGHALARVAASWALGVAHGLAGDWSTSVAALDTALTLARERRVLWAEPWLLTSLANAHLEAGNAQLAQARAKEALSVAQQYEARPSEIDAHLAMARVRRCLEGQSALTAIEVGLERALALVRETGARGFEPHIYFERAELARLKGDEATRQRELREAHRLFTEIGAPVRAAEVARELGLSATA